MPADSAGLAAATESDCAAANWVYLSMSPTMFMPMRESSDLLQLVGQGDVFDDELGEFEAERGEGGLDQCGDDLSPSAASLAVRSRKESSLAAKVSVMRAMMVLRSWSSRSAT